MIWNWNIKTAADEVQPQMPVAQPAPAPAPAPAAPIPQVQPQPVQPMKQPVQQPTPAQQVEQIKRSPEGDQMRKFVREPQNSPIAPATLIQTYKANPATWQAFSEIADAELGGGGRKEFIQAWSQVTDQGAPTENVEVDNRIDQYLTEARNLFFNTYVDFITQTSKIDGKKGKTLELAEGIIPAITNVFSHDHQQKRGLPKWKHLIDAVVSLGGQFADQSRGIDFSTDVKQSLDANQKPQSIVLLEQIVQSDDPTVQNAVKEFMIHEAFKGKYYGGKGLSLDKDLGDGDTGASLAAEKRKDAAMPEEQLKHATSTYDAFVNNPSNAQVFQYLNGLAFEDAAMAKEDEGVSNPNYTQPMASVIAKVKRQDPKFVVAEAVRSAFVGWDEHRDSKWKSFFKNYPHLLKNLGFSDNSDDLEANEAEAFEFMTSIAQAQIGSPLSKALRQLQDFVISSAEEYITNQFRQSFLDRSVKDKVVNVLGMDVVKRITKLVDGILKRQYNIARLEGGDGIGEARRFALCKAKNAAIRAALKQIAETNEPIQFTKTLRLSKNNEGILLIEHGTKDLEGNVTWEDPRPFSNSRKDIDSLFWTVRLPKWAPEVFNVHKELGELDKAQGREPQEKAMWRQSKLKGLTPIDQETINHQKENPQAIDRLEPWRKAMGLKIKQLREASGKTPEEINAFINAKAKENNDRIRRPDFYSRLEAGLPVYYDRFLDLKFIAKALSTPTNPVSMNDFYQEPLEYDKFDKKDLSDMVQQIPQAFRMYGPKLLEAKYESIRRKQSFYSSQAFMYYLTMLGGTHPNFSAEPQPKWDNPDKDAFEEAEREKKKADPNYKTSPGILEQKRQEWAAYDAQEKEKFQKTWDAKEQKIKAKKPNYQIQPMPEEFWKKMSEQKTGTLIYQLLNESSPGTGSSTEKIKQNLKHVPLLEETDSRYYAPGFAGSPPDSMQTFYPDPEKYPNPTFLEGEDAPQAQDIRRKALLADPEQWLQAIQAMYPANDPKRTIAYWAEETNRKSTDKVAKNQAYMQQLQQASQGNPIDAAKNILQNAIDDPENSVFWFENGQDANTAFDAKLQKANEYAQRQGGPAFTPETFAQKLIDDTMKTKQSQIDIANKRIADFQNIGTFNTRELIMKFVPLKVRRDAIYHGTRTPKGEYKAVGLRPEKGTDEAGNIIEKYDFNTMVNLFKQALQELDRLGDMRTNLDKYASKSDIVLEMMVEVVSSANMAFETIVRLGS